MVSRLQRGMLSYAADMAAKRVGAIDDPIWLTPPEELSRRALSRVVIWESVMTLILVPLVWYFVRGLDWEAAVYAAPIVLALLVLFQRRWLVPVLLSLALAPGLLVMVEAANVVGHHTLRLNGPPPALAWCGRTYSNPTLASAASPLANEVLTSHRVKALTTPSGTVS